MPLDSNQAVLVPPTPATAVFTGTNDIRALKAPVEIPSGWAWLWWAWGILAVLALLVVLVRVLRRRALPPIIPAVPPHLRARQRLERALQQISEPQPFCFAVSDALRGYLEERFELRAPERTTEEFLHDVRATKLLSAPQKQSLEDFLIQCDLVKFARHEPTETDLRGLYESALRLIDETAPYGETATAVPPPVPAQP